MTRTAAVLPLKSFDRAKSRLGDWAGRSELAAAMAADVLEALSRVRGIDEVIVVARWRPDDPRVTWVPDEREDGHVAAAELGIDAAVANGAERVLLVPGDCPALEPEEVEDLLGGGFRLPGSRKLLPSATPGQQGSRKLLPSATLVPDVHGTGTNALLLSPPDVIRPSFGPGSFARHAAFARAARAELRIAEPPSLLLDVDTPEDLEALQAFLAPGVAPRTRELLSAVR